jgi:hypothetical protein
MPEEPTATPEVPAAEPSPEATAPAPEPAKPEPKPEPDYRAAYVGLQRSQNKLHTRVEDVLSQNRLLADTVKALKEGQQAILKQTVGEDEANAIAVREVQARERTAALEAAQTATQLIGVQAGLFLETLKEAGVNPDDPSIDWARDASNVQEWAERVGPSVKAALRNANEARIRKTEEGLKAKSQKEIREEAEALTQRQLKEQGVDRIDTGKGSSTASFLQRIREVDVNSPEFARMLNDAKAGRLKT